MKWWCKVFNEWATAVGGLSRLYFNRNLNLNTRNEDLADSKSPKNAKQRKREGRRQNSPAWLGFSMKTYKNIYTEIISLKNLFRAWKKARKGKTQRDYVIG